MRYALISDIHANLPALDAVLAEMKAAAPKLLALSRLQNVACRDALIDWAESQYDLLPLDFAHNSVYVARTTEAPK